jgi:hypothetical protein
MDLDLFQHHFDAAKRVSGPTLDFRISGPRRQELGLIPEKLRLERVST